MNDINAAIHRGQACLDGGDPAQAERELRAVLEQVPREPRALHLLGIAAHQQGDPQRAVRLIGLALELSPQDATVARNLGLARAASGDATGAVAALETALALAPGDPHTTLQLASLQHQTGSVSRALDLYRQVLEQLPDLAELHNQIGVCLLQLDEPEDAAVRFQHCLSREPGHAAARENLARARLRQARAEEVERILAGWLEHEPAHPEAWRLLGYARAHRGELEHASEAFLTPVRAQFTPPGPGGDDAADAASATRTKLRHDLEQLRYLREQGRLDAARAQTLEAGYARALEALPADTEQAFFHPLPQAGRFADSYNRLHLDWMAPRQEGGALNPALDHGALARCMQEHGYAVVDDILRAEALSALRRFCTESTIWFEKKFRNEVGASLRNGFCCPLLLQIAQELRAAFPDTFGRHMFSGCFSYKYYRNGVPGNVHADRGAVSMNVWITPDEANLDPGRGGLEVWNKRVPPEYFREDPEEIDRLNARLTAEPDARAEHVPYRCNRAILFPSDILHRTDPSYFADGYLNRRISVTFLFGQPGD